MEPSESARIREALAAAERLDPATLDLAVRALHQTDAPGLATLAALTTACAALSHERRMLLRDQLGHLQGQRRRAQPGGHRYPRSRFLNALRKCAKHYGKPPTVREYKKWRENIIESPEHPGDVPHHNSIRARLGGWPNALREAGITC